MTKKEQRYKELYLQIPNLIDNNCQWIANYSNFCAAIQQQFHHWWCGIYLINSNNQLELTVFQGPVACTLIEYNKGVCGKAWARQETIIVPNVHEFEGHIACSSESNSEIVIPIIFNEKVVGVLDIDSINYNEFDETDKFELIKLLQYLPYPQFNK